MQKSGMTTSGHFADPQGVTSDERDLTNSESIVKWADTQNSHGAKAGCGPISPIPPGMSTRNFIEEANAHNCRNLLTEQHVHWQEQGRNALNFQQASFERAAQEYGQAVRDEVHVAVAQATEISRAEMREMLLKLKQCKPGLLIKLRC